MQSANKMYDGKEWSTEVWFLLMTKLPSAFWQFGEKCLFFKAQFNTLLLINWNRYFPSATVVTNHLLWREFFFAWTVDVWWTWHSRCLSIFLYKCVCLWGDVLIKSTNSISFRLTFKVMYTIFFVGLKKSHFTNDCVYVCECLSQDVKLVRCYLA